MAESICFKKNHSCKFDFYILVSRQITLVSRQIILVSRLVSRRQDEIMTAPRVLNAHNSSGGNARSRWDRVGQLSQIQIRITGDW
jgi:hypothetical protein